MLRYLTVAAIILAITTIILIANARDSNVRQHKRYVRWLPIAALIAGPVVALVWWTLDHFLSGYVIIADSWAALPFVLGIGTFVGIVTSIVFAIALRTTPRREH